LSLPNIEQKIAFLSRPETYPEPTRRVETKETRMSWVFLTYTQAWKLKKPVLSVNREIRKEGHFPYDILDLSFVIAGGDPDSMTNIHRAISGQ
jgi:hypothetical protein